MAGDDMRHLVREHRGEFGVVAGERQQSSRHIKLAVGQREGVDGGRVENGDLVFKVGPFRGRHQLFHHARDQRLEPGVLVGAAIGGENTLMLALIWRERVRLPGQVGQGDRPIAVHVAGAAAQREREQHGRRHA